MTQIDLGPFLTTQAVFRFNLLHHQAHPSLYLPALPHHHRSMTDLHLQQERFGDERLDLRFNPTTQVSEISIDFSFLAPMLLQGAKITLKCGKSVLELRNCDQVWNTFSKGSQSLNLSTLLSQPKPRNYSQSTSTALIQSNPLRERVPAVSGSGKRQHDDLDGTRSMNSTTHADGDTRSAGYAESTATPPSSRRPSPYSIVPQTESNMPARKKRRIAPKPVASSPKNAISPNQEMNVTNIPSFGAPFTPNYHLADLAGSSTSGFTGYDVQPLLSDRPSDYIPFMQEIVPAHPVMSAGWKGKGRETGRQDSGTDYIQPMMSVVPPPFPNYPCPTPMAQALGSTPPARVVTKSSAGNTSDVIHAHYFDTSRCIQTARHVDTGEGAATTTNVAGEVEKPIRPTKKRRVESKNKAPRLNPYEQIVRFDEN